MRIETITMVASLSLAFIPSCFRAGKSIMPEYEMPSPPASSIVGAQDDSIALRIPVAVQEKGENGSNAEPASFDAPENPASPGPSPSGGAEPAMAGDVAGASPQQSGVPGDAGSGPGVCPPSGQYATVFAESTESAEEECGVWAECCDLQCSTVMSERGLVKTMSPEILAIPNVEVESHLDLTPWPNGLERASADSSHTCGCACG